MSWLEQLKLAVVLVAMSSVPLVVARADGSASSLIETGKYLATAGNCISCHTRPGGQPFAGGVSFETQFGTIYSTNITPDPETGIGRWTQAQFRRAMREGIDADGEHLYPAFPYTSFAKLSDADLDAIFAWLLTVAPASVGAPKNELAFPFNQRWLMPVWKALYFDGDRYTPNTTKSSEWNRGAYLVEGLGHCGACHTPRNFMGSENADLALTGGTYLDTVPGGQIRMWSAVNLTSAESGLASWSTDELVAYLQTGLNSYATTFGPMNKVIMHSTRHLSPVDARAMAVYLKDLPPNEQSDASTPSNEVMASGQHVYTIHCGTCHLPTGKGAFETGPALVGNPVVQAASPASLINVILYGPELPDPAPPAQREHMRGYDAELSDDEVAALASFLRSAWGNRGGPVSADQVAAQR